MIIIVNVVAMSAAIRPEDGEYTLPQTSCRVSDLLRRLILTML